ncbi:MAG: SAM-dependent methyltransferase [Crocinitomicaceae bacterium]|nr:SAM-dependent methyltransferase [Crocinitomicaceae bacterium]|tara:strand:+ start:9300 stop:9959 length:660 start_codon:yes stop_codon:yes gene_type:complete
MQQKIILTKDGSSTIFLPEIKETYHSKYGAIEEANHVFIKNGLNFFHKSSLKIFEMGFGTGLNCLLTAIKSIEIKVNIEYSTVEPYPITRKVLNDLNYTSIIGDKYFDLYNKIHNVNWESRYIISQNFSLKKNQSTIQDYSFKKQYFDIIFYDAFGPRVQPELWSVDVLQKNYFGLRQGGILVTYCAQGQFKRNLKKIGFKVLSMPGPVGKREMTIAMK